MVHLNPQPDTVQLPSEEDLLIRGAQKGDRQAFGQLVERYWDGLHRWLYHLTHDRHVAEDLTQDTFLKVFKGLKTFRPGSNFRAWLFRIAHNTLANRGRKVKRIQEPFHEDLPTREAGPEEQALSHEALDLLAQAVSHLPPDFRAAFLLRAEQGLSFREIGQVMGITEETARWRVSRRVRN